MQWGKLSCHGFLIVAVGTLFYLRGGAGAASAQACCELADQKPYPPLVHRCTSGRLAPLGERFRIVISSMMRRRVGGETPP